MVAGILPGLWQEAIVPVDVVGVKPKLTLLNILLDRSALLILNRDSFLAPNLPSLLYYTQCIPSVLMQCVVSLHWLHHVAVNVTLAAVQVALYKLLQAGDHIECIWAGG